MKEITERQQAVLDFIGEYVKYHMYSPSIRDIASYFSITHQAAYDHVLALKRKGFLSSEASTPRTLGILSADDNPLGFVEIPVLGSIAAGLPTFAEENFEGTVVLHRTMVKNNSVYFALVVRGDSMEGAGIFEDDIAIIEQCNTVRNGEIAAVQLEDAGSATATLKRFFKERERVCLRSENPKYAPLYYSPYDHIQDMVILGRLATIVRNY